MKAMKLSAVAVGVCVMLSGCGEKASSGGVRQGTQKQASVPQYVSQDGCWRVSGPVWDCSRRIDGEWHYPVAISKEGQDGRVCWCREVSHGSCGNFDVASEDGLFYLADSSFCHSDEMKVITYMDFVSGAVTNRIELKRIDL